MTDRTDPPTSDPVAPGLVDADGEPLHAGAPQAPEPDESAAGPAETVAVTVVDEGNGPTGESRTLYLPQAVIDRVPRRVRQITRVQTVALALFTLILFGPVVALVVNLRTADRDVPVVAREAAITDVDGLLLTFTITSVNAVNRELGVRMTIKSSSQEETGLIEAGRMTQTVNIALPAPPDSLQGDQTLTLEEGDSVGGLDFVVQLAGSVSRYPYDRYESDMVIIASSEPGAGAARDPVPISIEVRANVPGFVVEGDLPPDLQGEGRRDIHMEVRRDGPTLAYTTWIMFMWWALSVSAVFILWSVAIWGTTTPPWAYGYLVGVLFALAPLRGALPGEPPYGVLIDYVSFYWAVGTIGIGLLLLVFFFVRGSRYRAGATGSA